MSKNLFQIRLSSVHLINQLKASSNGTLRAHPKYRVSIILLFLYISSFCLSRDASILWQNMLQNKHSVCTLLHHLPSLELSNFIKIGI